MLLGVIVGNRDFFPDKLVTEARADLVELVPGMGLNTVMLGADDTKLGGVETHADARKCAALFREHRERIAGVLVVLPNFGDEKGVANDAHLISPVSTPSYRRRLDCSMRSMERA
ncbi:MAG: hypothetical protein ABSG50_14350 [Opitutaceae bacterium]